ncbi:trehalose-phosphatase [Acinetobacter sp. ANC 7454]|uniref:trehalose-phosphatase n=1 Tax=Acinetobacter thermotolerans TaxID=3151487 RepID=UPI00325BDA0B
MKTSYPVLDLIFNKIANKVERRSNINNNPFILFLDIDGTLSEFHPDPEKSFIPTSTLHVLNQLQQLIPLYLVTGRSISQAQKLIQPHQWNIAGSHGLELLQQDGSVQQLVQVNLEELNQLKVHAQQHSEQWHPIRVEIKTYSIALHFREHPEYADQAKAIIEDYLKHNSSFELKSGKCVYELVPRGCNKGAAIRHVLNSLEDHALYPIFIGDDLTDEAGFHTINDYGGMSIKVGPGESAARGRLDHVADVGFFLHEFLTTLQALKQEMKGENTCPDSLYYPTA